MKRYITLLLLVYIAAFAPSYALEGDQDTVPEVSVFVRDIASSTDNQAIDKDIAEGGSQKVFIPLFSEVDSFVYYIYYYASLFYGFPWVVRVAYGLIILSTVGLWVLFIVMIVNVYLKYRREKIYKQLKKRYFDSFKDCIYDENNLSTRMIIKRTQYKERNWNNMEMMEWARILVEICLIDRAALNYLNAQRITVVIGFDEFAKRHILYGGWRTKARMIEAVRLTNTLLPGSIVATLVNHKSPELRKTARFYRILVTQHDPVTIFEEEQNLTMVFRIWDMMELHRTFQYRAAKKWPSPTLISIIKKVHFPNFAKFLMQEIAYWGSDDEMRALMDFFNSKDYSFRKTAFCCMGIRRFEEAEDVMKRVYDDQTELLHRVILKSIAQINSGRSKFFFAEAYNKATSTETKICALFCLRNYGNSGAVEFDLLKKIAPENDKVFFEHVESMDPRTQITI